MAENSSSKSITKWSAQVTKEHDALSLKQRSWNDLTAIALRLNNSAEASTRQKAEALRPAISIQVFRLNRAGKNLDSSQNQMLEIVKQAIGDLFGSIGSDMRS